MKLGGPGLGGGVAPFAGAWIEIFIQPLVDFSGTVAPFAGAWIEISNNINASIRIKSLPSRERGLKFRNWVRFEFQLSRSLRGSVD